MPANDDTSRELTMPELTGKMEALRSAFVILVNSLEPAQRDHIKRQLQDLMPVPDDDDNPWLTGRWEMIDYLVRHIGR